jgi:hypothetical protein
VQAVIWQALQEMPVALLVQVVSAIWLISWAAVAAAF